MFSILSKLDWNVIITSIITTIATIFASSLILKIKKINILNFKFVKNKIITNKNNNNIRKYINKVLEKNFENNFIKLENTAKKIATERANELLYNFLYKLDNIDNNIFDKLSSPDNQMAIFNAQKIYAKSGEEDKKNILLNLLLKKVNSEHISLTEIKINMALEVIEKLTIKQIDMMCLFYTVCYSSGNFNTIEDFKKFANDIIKPFLYSIPLDINNAKHLEELNLIIAIAGKHYLPYYECLQNNFDFLKNYSGNDINKILLSLDKNFNNLSYINETQFFHFTDTAEVICRSRIEGITGIILENYYSE